VTNRYHTIAAVTAAYIVPQMMRAGRFVMNCAPSANWWLNARATAR
jgi:hypothetical protein